MTISAPRDKPIEASIVKVASAREKSIQQEHNSDCICLPAQLVAIWRRNACSATSHGRLQTEIANRARPADLRAENAALRHQLIVPQRRVSGRVQLTNGDPGGRN